MGLPVIDLRGPWPPVVKPAIYRVGNSYIVVLCEVDKQGLLEEIARPLPMRRCVIEMRPLGARYLGYLKELLRAFGLKPFRAIEAIEKLGWKPSSGYVHLKRLWESGALVKETTGRYRVNEFYIRVVAGISP